MLIACLLSHDFFISRFLVSPLRILIKRVQRLSALTNREAEWEMSRRKESNIEAHGWFKWFSWDHESGFNIFLCEEPVRISAALRQCLAVDLIDDFHFNWNELSGNANGDIISFILPYSKVRSTELFCCVLDQIKLHSVTVRELNQSLSSSLLLAYLAYPSASVSTTIIVFYSYHNSFL